MRRKRRRKSSLMEDIILLLLILIETIIRFIIRLIIFMYDLLTYKTSQYGQKSGYSFFKTYFDKGHYGEFIFYRKVIRILGKASVLTNVYLENINTDTTEVDVIGVSEKGIYIFEVKNFGGYIYGSEKDKYWTQVFNRKAKHQFFNPLRQNYAHTMALKRYLLTEDHTLHPMIVFSNRSKLSKINISHHSHVYQIKNALKYIKRHEKKAEPVFTKKEIQAMVLKLLRRCHMPDHIRVKHIQDVMALQDNIK